MDSSIIISFFALKFISFIDDNTDYVSKFKENNLYIRKYSLLKLILVKAKRGVDYDYENNEWIWGFIVFKLRRRWKWPRKTFFK